MSALDFKAWVDPLTLSPASSRWLRFTSGMAPTDPFLSSMAAEPFSIHVHIQALVELEPGIDHAFDTMFNFDVQANGDGT